jgi:hypothetical protein
VVGDWKGRQISLNFGEPLPEEIQVFWDVVIEQGITVGPDHWQWVPSTTEPEGFVAGCLWTLRDAKVVGFDVPEPDPDLIF